MSDFVTVCRAGDIPPGEAKAVAVNGKVVAVFNDGGEFFAIDDTCPHMGASLATGFVEKGIVTCPWHAWRFRLADGVWADNPRIGIGCYPVRVEGDSLQVHVPPRPAPPPPPS